MRNIQEVKLTNAEKVKIHFLFREMKLGYVQVARAMDMKPTDIPDIVAEVDGARLDFIEREPVVYRRHYVNPNRGKSKDLRLEARKNSIGHPYGKLPESMTAEKSWEISRASMAPSNEALENLLSKFNS